MKNSPLKGLSLMAVLLAAGIGTVQAAPAKTSVTRIVFPQGSYCGIFAGMINGKRDFSLHLAKGQTLTVMPEEGAFKDIQVRDAKKVLLNDFATAEVGEDIYYSYTIKNTGVHKISIKLHGNEWRSIEFCAA